MREKRNRIREASEEDLCVIDKLNIAFKMYDITGVKVCFEAVSKGSCRPFRVRFDSRNRGNPPTYSYQMSMTKYFETSKQMGAWCQKWLIEERQRQLEGDLEYPF